jgi:quercetin dioxygenase-like cupin family protein
MSTHELGFFGNIWVRQNVLPKAGDTFGGHKHHFDHVSLLTKGKVKVEVEGHPAKEFKAPTFIVIKKEHNHNFIALEDDTNWYCVFALRDLDGEVVEIFDQEKHNPLSALPAD